MTLLEVLLLCLIVVIFFSTMMLSDPKKKTSEEKPLYFNIPKKKVRRLYQLYDEFNRSENLLDKLELWAYISSFMGERLPGMTYEVIHSDILNPRVRIIKTKKE